MALIFAQTDPELGHKGIACFLVDTDQDGYQPQAIHHKMGLRGSDTAEIALDDVHVDADGMLGEIGDGFKVAMTSLDSGRYSRRRRLRRHLPGLRRAVGRVLQGARAVRAPDRLASSSCRR